MTAAPMHDAAPVASPEVEALAAELAEESTLVFDLDDTLYDARDFERPALAAVADWLRERSGRPLPEAARSLRRRRERDRHRPGLFDDLLHAEGLPLAWGAECLRRFHGYAGLELAHAPSLKPLIRSLHAGGRALALVSNGPPELQARKLARLGLEDAFDVRVYCDPRDRSQLKPSRWAWERLAAWRGDARAVHVGDDAVDAAFASAGGARYVRFRFRNAAHED